ncbi:MAG: hypothetical protein J6J65_03960 [Opitutales bacterium]|nr:hypothetical protein [Opitutales bacterium]
MTSEQKILLRENLLKQLAEARPFGMLAARLAVGARMWNFNLPEPEIARELEILARKGLVEAKNDAMAIAQSPHWKITQAGLEMLDSRGY